MYFLVYLIKVPQMVPFSGTLPQSDFAVMVQHCSRTRDNQGTLFLLSNNHALFSWPGWEQFALTACVGLRKKNDGRSPERVLFSYESTASLAENIGLISKYSLSLLH
ncbi:hypothetical protein PHYBLDRAFT_72013 [Phycomyces blakesleeanus NRRL 1555(-)]|uniref:Uncharacterized protein n=1 Tax=Phycomyces blakesleeanus (strain ATCC 8743b / DSM 1359 / FGSC 10004 / NBRC 33097 / NRRL 1555) TaxID=763407 RepID=A0A162UHB2_PHYB8|nr:hypothetical protein PHYBLDRAFT_72013 [Phycomyces blakesleeanus NRRL 1555(-)]OAD75223.1 hypothetical protein PHYBLDRAFT_72013 [Phycomyces blakesleeanus NRRL 1555(-)]|eukprot:XP_018293263.1 hypothetical protein PHYBLDRAFT_72013 [Phycomyces blakesleeanus NRRL 1555(-)]